MKRHFLCITLAATLGTFSAPAFATTVPVSKGATAPAARYSIDTKISDMLSAPRALEVLKAFVQRQRVAAGKPQLTEKQQSRLIGFVHGMTPRQIARFPQAHLDAAALSELNVALAQIPVAAPSQG